MTDKAEVRISEDGKKARREYHRQWQRANREKARLYQERYWNKVAIKAENDKETEKAEE